jgi:hypothetical protein
MLGLWWSHNLVEVLGQLVKGLIEGTLQVGVGLLELLGVVEGAWGLLSCGLIHALGETSDKVGQEVKGNGGGGEGRVWRVQVA